MLKIQNDDRYQGGIASIVYKFFDKKGAAHKGTRINSDAVSDNQQLAEELHKQIIRKFKKREVHSSFKDIIWGVHLVDMKLISKYNTGIRFLYCVIDNLNKYAWIFPLKDKKGITNSNIF